jgi:hypothetical protein
MRFRFWLVLLALAPATAMAWGDNCKLRADRAAGVEAGGVEKVVIRTGPGEMKVVGRANAVRIEARGVACAQNQAMLDRTLISVRREGNTVYVETQMPQDEPGFSWGEDDHSYVVIGIALPINIPVDAIDSSGDAEFEDLESLVLQDSSGSLEIRRITGLADIEDSSGELNIERAGSVRVRDSSGGIEIQDVRGDVEVPVDSSGEIHITNVGGNVHIQQDSSGEIHIEDVKGSVRIDADSSGGIYAGRVGGDFAVGADGSGDISLDAIGGRISLPNGMAIE